MSLFLLTIWNWNSQSTKNKQNKPSDIWLGLLSPFLPPFSDYITFTVDNYKIIVDTIYEKRMVTKKSVSPKFNRWTLFTILILYIFEKVKHKKIKGYIIKFRNYDLLFLVLFLVMG